MNHLDALTSSTPSNTSCTTCTTHNSARRPRRSTLREDEDGVAVLVADSPLTCSTSPSLPAPTSLEPLSPRVWNESSSSSSEETPEERGGERRRESSATFVSTDVDCTSSALFSNSLTVSPTSVVYHDHAEPPDMNGLEENTTPFVVVSSSSSSSSSSSPKKSSSAALQSPDFFEFHHLNDMLEQCQWKKLRKALSALLTDLDEYSPDDVSRMLSQQQNNSHQGESFLHTLAWKAPPEVVMLALRLLDSSSSFQQQQQQQQQEEALPSASSQPRLLLLLQGHGEDQNTPVHLACANFANHKNEIPILKLLLLQGHGEDQNTPVHLACANFANHKNEIPILKTMAMLAPEALSLPNSHGDTPLHLLVSSPAFIRSPDFLAEAEAAASLTYFLDKCISCCQSSSSDDDEDSYANKKEHHPQQKEIALRVNHDLATMLHICLSAGAHERVILQLLETAPEAARMPDKFGFLPIHYVASAAASSSSFVGGDEEGGGGTGNGSSNKTTTMTTPWPVVAKLLEIYPCSVRAQTTNGDTPLHLLMSNGNKFLKRDCKFLDRNTTKLAELLMGKDNNDDNNSSNSNNNENASRSSSTDTSTGNDNGGLLLPLQQPLPPLLMRNKSDLNPLQVAACFDSPPQLIRILMESPRGPEAAVATTTSTLFGGGGSTPLHLACTAAPPSTRNGGSGDSSSSSKGKSSKRLLGCVEALVTPTACAIRDSLGRTPLMLAVQNKKVNKKVIRALLRVYPNAAVERTRNGCLPLHLALQSKYADENVIKALIQEYPQSVFEKNENGDTPLHEACLVSKMSYDVVALLAKKNPAAVDWENSSNELPIDRARAVCASNKIQTLLLDTSKSLKENEERKKTRAAKVSPLLSSSYCKEAGKSVVSSPSLPSNKEAGKSVAFFVPQLREPSVNSNNNRGAPDPPANVAVCSPKRRPLKERSGDPSPLRQEETRNSTAPVVVVAAPKPTMSPPSASSSRTMNGKTSSPSSPASPRSAPPMKDREFVRSSSVQRQTGPVLPRPMKPVILERRARSETMMVPPPNITIPAMQSSRPKSARKQMGSLESLAVSTRVYRFEI